MYKTVSPCTNVNKLNKSINRKVGLHAYGNSHIPQMGIRKVIIINEKNEYQCNFIVVPGNVPAFWGCQTLNGYSC